MLPKTWELLSKRATAVWTMGKAITYKVRACKGTNCSDFSSVLTVSVELGVPAELSAGPDYSGSYTLTWSSVTGAGSYVLEEIQKTGTECPSDWAAASAADPEPAANSYAVSGKAGGAEFCYRVQARASPGLWGLGRRSTVYRCPAWTVLQI